MPTISLLSAERVHVEGRCVLRCVFEQEGEDGEHQNRVDIEMLPMGSGTVLALEAWEDLFLGDREALSQMGRSLGLAMKGEPWPRAVIRIEPQTLNTRASEGRSD